jgi:hypothetical protein
VRAVRLGAVAAVAICTLLGSAAPVSANRTESTIFDPGGIVDPGLSAASRSRTLDRIHNLGADTVRVLARGAP